jgi:hypothetical protein
MAKTFKEVLGASSVDGEKFGSALAEGYLASSQDCPFKRDLPWIVARRERLKREAPGTFEDYGDGRITVDH